MNAEYELVGANFGGEFFWVVSLQILWFKNGMAQDLASPFEIDVQRDANPYPPYPELPKPLNSGIHSQQDPLVVDLRVYPSQNHPN